MMTSAIVALCILAAFALLCWAAVSKYGADDAIKVILTFSTVFGSTLGVIGTYFFTQTQVATARAEATAARNLAVQYRDQLARVSVEAAQARSSLVRIIDTKPSSYTLENLKIDSSYKELVMKLNDVATVEDTWQGRAPQAEKQPQK